MKKTIINKNKQASLAAILETTIEGIGNQAAPLNQYQTGMQDGIRFALRLMREAE